MTKDGVCDQGCNYFYQVFNLVICKLRLIWILKSPKQKVKYLNFSVHNLVIEKLQSSKSPYLRNWSHSMLKNDELIIRAVSHAVCFLSVGVLVDELTDAALD